MPTQSLPQSPPAVTPWRPAPQCARCRMPLSDVDVVFAAVDRCAHCHFGRTTCPKCGKVLNGAEAALAARYGNCGTCGAGPETDEDRSDVFAAILEETWRRQ